VQHHTHDDGVKLMFAAEVEDGKLSKREIEALRMVLPQLMIELVQSIPDDEEDKE
jgi:hypothetical protein